jgi:hypothetical protein
MPPEPDGARGEALDRPDTGLPITVWFHDSAPYFKCTLRRAMFKMEKLIVLAGLTAIVVFVATYALSAWSEHR